MRMIVCDLSAIEYAVLGWVSRCRSILGTLRAGRDPYLDFAVYLYHNRKMKYEDFKSEYENGVKEYRQTAKSAVLGCGYGLGGGELTVNEFGDEVRSGLWGYALNICGVDMPKELASNAVEIYRKTYPEVPQFWMDMEQAFKQTLATGHPISVGKVTWDRSVQEWYPVAQNPTQAYITFSRIDNFEYCKNVMAMKLPSGRSLHYLNAYIEEEEYTYTDKKTGKKRKAMGEVIYYEGVEHSTTMDESGAAMRKKMNWGRVKTYGGKLTENAVQAIARDVLVHGAHLAEEMGFQLFGTFHDELACLVDEGFDAPSLTDLRYCMSQPPPWAKTMVLGAEGYEGQFYRKG